MDSQMPNERSGEHKAIQKARKQERKEKVNNDTEKLVESQITLVQSASSHAWDKWKNVCGRRGYTIFELWNSGKSLFLRMNTLNTGWHRIRFSNPILTFREASGQLTLRHSGHIRSLMHESCAPVRVFLKSDLVPGGWIDVWVSARCTLWIAVKDGNVVDLFIRH